jgi:hypothetical protein
MRRALVTLALVVAAAGCGAGPSLVVVDVSADAPLDGVSAFAVQVDAGGKHASYNIAAPSGSLSLDPATQSFGIDLPKGMTGTISVSVDAVDATSNVLASGSASAPIKASGRLDLPLMLAVVGASGNDLGAPPDLVGSVAAGDMALPVAAAMLTVDRATQKFGSVTVGKSSNPVMIKVTNTGDLPSSALAFATSGANLDQFMLTNGCSGTLAAGASCAVTAEFAPTAAGDKAAHFDVSATTGGSVGVDVSGTGEPPGTLTISADAPYNGDCGSAVLNQTSTTFATYTVTNVGTSATGAMTVSTGDPQFIATGCSGMLMPAQTCTLTVHIKPTVHGMVTSSVQVTATPGGTAPANVQGTGLNPAAFKLTSSTGSFDFGSAQRNSAGNVITFTATNTGDVASGALAHSTLTGANTGSFLITADTSCYMQAITPSNSCTVQVELKPLQSGPLAATLHINDASGSLGSANLTGAGTPLWQQETLPVPTGQTAVPGLSAVFGIKGDGSHIYAAGTGYYYERDATGTWTAYPLNPAGVSPNAIGMGAALATNSVMLASDVGVLQSTSPTAWNPVYEGGNMSGIVAFSASDAWAAGAGVSTSGLQMFRLTASGWATDVVQAGGIGSALWGSSDSDLWLGGVASIGSPVVYTPAVWHRDSAGTWTQQTVAAGCHFCPGSVSPSVAGLWGFGAPVSTLYAIMNAPADPAIYTPATGWTAYDGSKVPVTFGGSGIKCQALWGSSPSDMWFACDHGMFHSTGLDTWDPSAVYAVGTNADNGDAGFVYHYY